MKKTTIGIGLLVVALIFTGAWFWWGSASTAPAHLVDYKDATYMIEGKDVTLINGRAEAAQFPEGASQTVTQYADNNASGDLNGDGTPDIAFLLTQQGGGSGTFYYVVVAVKTPQGYQGTNAILLGDRIAPQTTEIHNGELVVNYAVRKEGEPMTASPSVGVSKYLKIKGMTLVESPHVLPQ